MEQKEGDKGGFEACGQVRFPAERGTDQLIDCSVFIFYFLLFPLSSEHRRLNVGFKEKVLTKKIMLLMLNFISFYICLLRPSL